MHDLTHTGKLPEERRELGTEQTCGCRGGRRAVAMWVQGPKGANFQLEVESRRLCVAWRLQVTAPDLHCRSLASWSLEILSQGEIVCNSVRGVFTGLTVGSSHNIHKYRTLTLSA